MRRISIAALWFFAFFCAHELAWSVFGSPRLLGIAVGAAAAAFVLIDPLRIVRTERPAEPVVRSSTLPVQQP